MSIVLDLTGVTVRYRNTVALAVEQLHLAGSIIAILGHNGAGKSTLMKLLLGIHPAESGRARVSIRHGENLLPLHPQRDMAFCPEMGAIFEDISVLDYVKLWCRLRFGHAKISLADKKNYLGRLEIEPLYKKMGRELSKGQRRRVQTAIGFMLSPKLFLFDEPFDGLDISRTEELIDIMLEVRDEMGIILSSHRMDVIERVADSACVLQDGGLLAAGATTEVAQELAGSTWIVPGPFEPPTGMPTWISRRDGRTLVTVRVSDEDELRHRVEGLSAVRRPATLGEAMSYHLRAKT